MNLRGIIERALLMAAAGLDVLGDLRTVNVQRSRRWVEAVAAGFRARCASPRFQGPGSFSGGMPT